MIKVLEIVSFDFETRLEYNDENMKYRPWYMYIYFLFLIESNAGGEAKYFKSSQPIQQPVR